MARYCEHNRETDSTGNVDCPWCTDDKIMTQCYAWMARAEKAEAELEAVRGERDEYKVAYELARDKWNKLLKGGE